MLVFDLTRYPLLSIEGNRLSNRWKAGCLKREKILLKLLFLFWSGLILINKKSITQYYIVEKYQDKRHSNGSKKKILPSISRLPPKPILMSVKPSKKWPNKFSWIPLANTSNIRLNLNSKYPIALNLKRKKIQNCLVVDLMIFFWIDKGIQICFHL